MPDNEIKKPPDYEAMYYKLATLCADMIELMQQTMVETEEIFVQSRSPLDFDGEDGKVIELPMKDNVVKKKPGG